MIGGFAAGWQLLWLAGMSGDNEDAEAVFWERQAETLGRRHGYRQM